MLLNAEQLNSGYGQAQVLWDVSFTVSEGEVVALIGANGAGKTTTLKSLVGLVPLWSGRVSFRGKYIENVPGHLASAHGIVYVPEGRRVFPQMTVAENLRMGAYNMSARQRELQTLTEVYAMFPRLAERKNQLAGTMSGGEQQMLAIARGLMAQPRLILLDEPSLGLAPRIVAEVFQTIAAICDRGITVLLVEQHINRILELVDRAYVLENGRVVLSGTPTDLRGNEHVREAYLGM